MITIVMTMLVAAGAWTGPVEVRHDENLCLSYRARLDGPYLVIETTLEPGWHTFAMDNRRRAEEKLAGKKALSVDHPTEIAVSGGMAVEGPWFQTPPADFSKPELRWFSWGFERRAQFATKIRRLGTAAVQMAVRGQACTDTICKNIDVTIILPPARSPAGDSAEINLNNLVRVR
jgi:hypothetical protein